MLNEQAAPFTVENYREMTDEGHVNNKGRDVVEEEIAKFLGMELQSYLEEK